MDRAIPFKLISATQTQDEIGQFVATEEGRYVYARDVQSVTRDEWFNAGKSGFKAEYQLKIFKYDYQGERECEVNGKRYGIYRTYEVGDDIELYLNEKTGVELPDEDDNGSN